MPALGEETAPDLSQEGIPKPGDVIAGKYRIERHIGKGGMATVLSARHIGIGQEVAIKVMHPIVAVDPAPVKRFEIEAKAAATLQGEHVVRILDVGKLNDELPYMVMEYLSGIDLGALTRARGPLPIEEAVEYVLQACEAVAEAHAKGIIHRDLKPSNLFLTQRPDGSPLIKVLDFGIAKVLEEEQNDEILQLTTTGMGMGSPQFMSPEQLRDAKMVDARADVWSLGVVLYQLLTTLTPFQGKSFSSLCATIAADPPTPIQTLRPDVPAPLAAVVMRCLEKNLDARMPNVAELARGLAPYASSTSTLSVTRIAKILAEEHPPLSLRGAARRASNPGWTGGGANRADGSLPNASSPTLAATLQEKGDPAARANHRPTLLAAVGGALCLGLILAAIWATGGRHDAQHTVPAEPAVASPPAPTARPAAPAQPEAVIAPSTSTAASPAGTVPAAASAPLRAASAAASAAPLAPGLPGQPGGIRPTSKKGVTRGDPLDDRK